MILKKWEKLPETMRNEDVKRYYDLLKKRKMSLILKRTFDIVASFLLLVLLFPLFLLVGLLILCDSRGGMFFCQTRVTTNGREFRIFKFRTMVSNAEKLGTLVTTGNDARVTRIGKFLRKTRLDEIPQLLNILIGDMTFVGTRPEVPRYVKEYTPEMLATLLLPAGVTSEASICYKDEAELLDNAADADRVYIEEVLPAKMKYNLEALEQFGFLHDLGLMFRTVGAVLGKN